MLAENILYGAGLVRGKFSFHFRCESAIKKTVDVAQLQGAPLQRKNPPNINK